MAKMCDEASFTECLICWSEYGYCPYEKEQECPSDC